MYNKVNDSGQREEFVTGSVRDKREGKGRYDLLPPFALHMLAKHYENGARKYDERNWEKGQPLHVYLDSALRHLNMFMMGDDSEDHLSAAAWNIMCLTETKKRIEVGMLPEKLYNIDFKGNKKLYEALHENKD